jgi:hypothetical protein
MISKGFYRSTDGVIHLLTGKKSATRYSFDERLVFHIEKNRSIRLSNDSKERKFDVMFFYPDRMPVEVIESYIFDFGGVNQVGLMSSTEWFGINMQRMISITKTRDINECFYCGRGVCSHTFKHGQELYRTRDHVIPASLLKKYGIYFIPNNLVPCCFECNQNKKDDTAHQWMTRLIRVSQSHYIDDTRRELLLKIISTLNHITCGSNLLFHPQTKPKLKR